MSHRLRAHRKDEGVGYFQYLGINERKIRADRDAVVQKAWILQTSVVTINVFLIQRPTNALRGTALKLTFNVVGVDRLTCVLDNGVTDNGRPTGFWIHFHVAI